MRRIGLALVTLACGGDGGNPFDPTAAASGDYSFEPNGGLLTPSVGGLRDSSEYIIYLDRQPVSGAPVRYRATGGHFVRTVETTTQRGETGYVWAMPRSEMVSGDSAVIFGCVVVREACTESRLIGFSFP